MEIQRLIGRSIRSILDFTALGETTLKIDCEVIDADGGTRTASVTGAYIALCDAVQSGLKNGLIEHNPIQDQVAAISAGIVNGEPVLDLTYEEDSRAEFDLNLVAGKNKGIIEIQGTAEGPPIPRDILDTLIDLAYSGIKELFEQQDLAFQ